MFQQIFESISVIILSAFNLYYGFCLSITYDQNHIEQFLFMSVGSLIGILACILLGAQLLAFWKRKISKKQEKAPEKAQKPSFLMRIWQKYGIWGLAFCTGFIGTIPTVIVSLLTGTDKYSIFWYLGGAKVLWAIFYTFVGQAAVEGILAAIF